MHSAEYFRVSCLKVLAYSLKTSYPAHFSVKLLSARPDSDNLNSFQQCEHVFGGETGSVN